MIEREGYPEEKVAENGLVGGLKEPHYKASERGSLRLRFLLTISISDQTTYTSVLLPKDRLVHALDHSTGMRLRQVSITFRHLQGFVSQNFRNLR
jgi:hypothetical protein